MIAIICATISDPNDKEYMIWLYQEFHRLMFSVAKKYVSNPVDSEDIVQDCLVSLMKKIRELRGFDRCVLVSYIVSTVRNTSINFLRRQGVQQEHTAKLDESVPLEAPTLDDLMKLTYRKEQLRRIWNQLSEEDRFLLDGKYLAGYSDKELAFHLKCKPSSIRMKLTRARRRAFALLMQQE